MVSILSLLLLELVQPSSSLADFIIPRQESALQRVIQTAEMLPRKTGISMAPVVSARSLYTVDATTGVQIYAHNIHESRSAASITKLMTAMVILDKNRLDETVTVSSSAAAVEGSSMLLKAGEKLTVAQLLQGLLIASGNDAAVALAEHNSTVAASFVEKMNVKARSLGMNETQFINPTGLDDDVSGYTTAFDVMLMAQAAMNYPFIVETAAKRELTVLSQGKNGLTHELNSTNELLENQYFQITGLKTGKTDRAGESLVSLHQNPSGHDILTVMLGSKNRFRETVILLDWINRNFSFTPNV